MSESAKDRTVHARYRARQSKSLGFEPESAQLNPATRRAIQHRLGTWYERNARDLAWRHTQDPYRVWVSEVMLQQTQVATVVPYYRRFVERFPTVRSLAASSIDDVLKYWEGLGYYRRAANLHRAAQVVVNEYGGELPKDADRLRKLPGIGRYIAGAIQSIAFDLPAAILEANSARVLCRLFAVRGAIDDGATNRVLWSLAGALVSSERPARHNQAIMELGALVCTPSQPDCGRCPLQALCQANLQGITEKVPVQARRHASVDVTDAAAIVRSRERILIVQRPHLERWGGLWELPRVTVGHGGDPCRVLSDHVQTSLGLEIEVGAEVFALKHTVTHHRITLKCYESRLVRGRPCPRGYEDCRWTVPGRLSEYPSSAPQRKVFGFVQNSADLGSGRRPGGR